MEKLIEILEDIQPDADYETCTTLIDDGILDSFAILSIVGESGCGKSTLCKMILRLHNPDMGDIVMDGKSYADKKSYDPKQFKLDVQPIFQNPYESFSARKTVDTYLYNTALRLGIAKNRAEADKVVDEALKSVGMSLAVVKGKYATPIRWRAAACIYRESPDYPSETDHRR